MQYVYLLENKYSPNVYKIGWTGRHPNIRAKEISQGTGVVGTWEVSYFWEVEDGYWLEQKIFKKFSSNRIKRSEMFLFPQKSSHDIYNLICDFILQKGESPKAIKELAEKQKNLQIEKQREQDKYNSKCDCIKSQIDNLVTELIELEQLPYKKILKLRYYIFITLSLPITYYLFLITTFEFVVVLTVSLLATSLISWLLWALICLLIPISKGDPQLKINNIKNKYDNYKNLPNNLCSLQIKFR